MRGGRRRPSFLCRRSLSSHFTTHTPRYGKNGSKASPTFRGGDRSCTSPPLNTQARPPSRKLTIPEEENNDPKRAEIDILSKWAEGAGQPDGRCFFTSGTIPRLLPCDQRSGQAGSTISPQVQAVAYTSKHSHTGPAVQSLFCLENGFQLPRVDPDASVVSHIFISNLSVV